VKENKRNEQKETQPIRNKQANPRITTKQRENQRPNNA
jgi:hypothetical protein